MLMGYTVGCCVKALPLQIWVQLDKGMPHMGQFYKIVAEYIRLYYYTNVVKDDLSEAMNVDGLRRVIPIH